MVEEVSDKINKDLQIFVSGTVKEGSRMRSEDTNLDVEIANSSHKPLPDSLQKRMHFKDKLLYIYTSGTTGKYSFSWVAKLVKINIIFYDIFQRFSEGSCDQTLKVLLLLRWNVLPRQPGQHQESYFLRPPSFVSFSW